MWQFAEGGWSVFEAGELLFGEGEFVLLLLGAVVFVFLGAVGWGFGGMFDCCGISIE